MARVKLGALIGRLAIFGLTFGVLAGSAQCQPPVPAGPTPLLDLWVSKVVKGVRLPGGSYTQLCKVNWPSSAEGYPIRVVNGQVVVSMWDGNLWQFFRLKDHNLSSLGEFEDGRISTFDYSLWPDGKDGLWVGFTNDSVPEMDTWWHLSGAGEPARQVAPERTNAATSWWSLCLGPPRKGSAEYGYLGPVSVFDAKGKVAASAPLPKGFVAIASPSIRRVTAGSAAFEVAVPMVSATDSDAMGGLPLGVSILLMELPRASGSGQPVKRRIMRCDDTTLRLLPSVEQTQGSPTPSCWGTALTAVLRCVR